MPGVYWLGQDGNVWWKTDQGVRNMGAPINYNGGGTNWDNGFDTGQLSAEATRIADPNAPQQQAPFGGGGGEAKVFNSAGASTTQRTLDELPAMLERALAAERQNYQNTVTDFNSQEAGQRKTYDTSTVTNQQNYDTNFMDSIRAGIKGLGGLMQILRGTGAAGGTAEDQARDTVGGVTSNDIRVGADTRKENQTALDTSLEGFLGELGRKRRTNEDALVNNERAIKRDNATTMQDLFGKMAGFYGDVGDKANADSWINRGAALVPEIAQNSSRQVSPYDTAPVAVQAPQLSAFADPTQPSVVTAPNGQVGSGIFTMNDTRRRKDAAPAPVPVGV